MRRTDRLFEIIQIVRDGRLHLARDIAEALEVSIRTVYRDIDTLAASGIPIEGERGVGYILREPIFLPPISLSADELEALTLGMALVAEVGDDDLQAAADRVRQKIEQSLPTHHLTSMDKCERDQIFGVYAFDDVKRGRRFLPALREAIHNSLRLPITYRSLAGTLTHRTIRPLHLEYWGRSWTCTSWCEKRDDFRVFRLDRIETTGEPQGPFDVEPGKSLEDYIATIEPKRP